MESKVKMKPRTHKALEIVKMAAELGDYDSNVIGMAAEIIVEEEFGMTKTPRGSKGVDGIWFTEGNHRSIQVKAWSEKRLKDDGYSTFVRLKTDKVPDDLMLIVVLTSRPGYLVLYKGPTMDGCKPGNLNKKQVLVVRLSNLIPTMQPEIKKELDTILGKL
jgi:hypothetical protein